MISKRKLVNALFIVNFLFFGFGQYITNNFSTPAGHMLSILPHILLIVFYALDSLYGRKFIFRVNLQAIWVLLFVGAFAYSGLVGLRVGIPGYDLIKTITEVLRVGVPFIGFLIWNFYNAGDESFDPVRQTLIGLGIYFIVNLMGVAAGITTLAHGFEDRISLPFSDGIYDGGNVLAIFAILIFPILIQLRGASVGQRFKYILYFGIICGLLFVINSRLTILILLFIMGIFTVRLAYVHWAIFIGAWCMIPFLLNSKMLVYNILSSPMFASILKRVDLEDITSYNSRAYIWERAVEWIEKDQTGILTGNGFRGFGTLRIYEDITDKWMVDVYTLHSHSTMLDLLICQGIIGLGIVFGMMFIAMRFFRMAKKNGYNNMVRFYPIVIFLLYLMQIDSFVYPGGIGFEIFLMLFSLLAVNRKEELGSDEEVKEERKELIESQVAMS
ncbi:MAG: hypothetical protein AAF694_10350 [Bacteroidota bacterium]